MEPNNKYKIIFFILIFFAASCGFSQSDGTLDFYKHFQGKLDTSMNITLDLLSQNGTLSGFYYYSFPEPGSPSTWHYGKTIPISGILTGKEINLKEFNNEESQFYGTITDDNGISGFWQKSPNDKAVPFLVKENYSQRSMPLSCYALSAEHLLINGDNAEKTSPRAKIKINILFPFPNQKNQANDSLIRIISKHLLKGNEIIETPKQFAEEIKDSYFDSYIKSAEGISDISNTGIFNREKRISMQVAYNENQLLSIIYAKYAKTGSPDGMEMIKYFVFSSKLNRELKIDDIITGEGLLIIDELLNKKLRKLNGIKDGENLMDAGFFLGTIEHNNNFYINNDGIGFLYNIYEIAPKSFGTTALFISFKELDKGSIKPGATPYAN